MESGNEAGEGSLGMRLGEWSLGMRLGRRVWERGWGVESGNEARYTCMVLTSGQPCVNDVHSAVLGGREDDLWGGRVGGHTVHHIVVGEHTQRATTRVGGARGGATQ